MTNEIPTLRDPQDRRLPRISPPCGLVIFGITGDLLFKEYGIDAEHVAAAAKESIDAARS